MMARTPKALRKWVKDEKRLIKLLYQKGFLKGDFDVKNVYWASHRHGTKRHKLGKYRFFIYYPELHFCQSDYFGEADEYSVVNMILDGFWFSGIDSDYDFDSPGWPKSDTKVKNRKQLFEHLKTLPTVIKDSKVNSILIKNYID